MPNKLKPAVGYIRMSTDRQEDSPARQRRDIEALAKRMGFSILRWYEDHGLTGTDSANRPEFLRLLADAKNGKFSAVLLSEQSRMSREDIFDATLHWRLLRDAGVQIVTCQRGEMDFNNLGGLITAIVDQYGAREESIKLAERVVSGQRNRALAGKRIGGFVFGYDREIIDESSNVVKVVHFRERFRKPPTWDSRLVPSTDTDAVEAVQWAFDSISRGGSMRAITNEFNHRKLKTSYGNAFIDSTVHGMLRNPTYAGILRVGEHSRGKFTRLTDNPIVVENAHEPLISPQKFERVQQILNGRRARSTGRKGLYYPLSGIVRCGHCGGRMHGVRIKVRGTQEEHLWYQCARKNRAKGVKPCERYPRVRADRLENAVLDIMREHVLTREAEPRIRKAILRATQGDKTTPTSEQRKLRDLRRKIERATENLALADKEDFAGIADLLAKWRDEEARLSLKIERQSEDMESLPEAIRVLSNLARIRDNLDIADREALGAAMHQTINRITIRNDILTSGQLTYREVSGDIHLHPLVNAGQAIVIPARLLTRPFHWMEVGELARRSTEPIHLKEVMELIGTKDPPHAHFHIRQALKAGIIIRLPGPAAGWVANI